MNQPIWSLFSEEDPVYRLGAEILRCEGFPWLEEKAASAIDTIPPDVSVVLAAGSEFTGRQVDRLLQWTGQGGVLIALSPSRPLCRALGISTSGPFVDARLQVSGLDPWEHGSERLLCPNDIAAPLQGGIELARLIDSNGTSLGSGLVSQEMGEGRVFLYGYDLCRCIVFLRHGNGRLDELADQAMGPLKGPRHLYSFFELSDKLSRHIPTADLHQDILRTLVEKALSGTSLPRIWHFPRAQPSLWFVKGDGCGEMGVETEVEVVEKGGAFLSFYRPMHSWYGGEQMHEWHQRGHGISIEANINPITQFENSDGSRQGRSVEEINEHRLPAIREHLQAHRDHFEKETGLAAETLCIHSCQWSGAPMARMLLELGWYTPTHFISHDPRMQKDRNYGPYMIGTGLPMRYFDPQEGLLDLWYMPAQWDESQTLGKFNDLTKKRPQEWPGWDHFPSVREFLAALPPDRARGMVGLSAEEYGLVLAQFAGEAANRWHTVQICNFHPIYVAIPQNHPRASRLALEMGIEGARQAGCGFDNLEHWSHFFRTRARVRLIACRRSGATTFITLDAPESIDGLTLLLPAETTQVRMEESGQLFDLIDCAFEGRKRHTIIINLESGKPVTLCLSGPEERSEKQ